MPSNTIAAIDLGSNSFHMIVARLTDGHFQVIDRLKEMVQLADGLDDNNKLAKDVQNRALDCLARFGQRLRHMPPSKVRIVGTNTLRKARNSRNFIAKAEAVLGHPIEIISGMEEARLIYLGVSHTTAAGDGRQLVVDIGGGSTELIIGEGFEPMHLESLYMGCVSMSRRIVRQGRIRESQLREAGLAVRMEMEPVTLAYQQLGWQRAIGASGTIKAVRDVLAAEGLCNEVITLEGMHKLRELLPTLKSVDELAERWSLEPARAKVFTGGFMVLYGVCEALGVEQMLVSDGALREGLLYDLVGRIRHEDVRDRTIATLTQRYGLDADHAGRVAETVRQFLSQVAEDWKLTDEQHSYDLNWATRLHEIGMAIAHNHYHKHGAYIIEHSDMPGFSNREQELMAALVRSHRRKFPEAIFDDLPEDTAGAARYLAILLRVASLLHRSRGRDTLPKIKLKTGKRRLELQFPGDWLDDHPLTRADLEKEADYLEDCDFDLRFR